MERGDTFTPASSPRPSRHPPMRVSLALSPLTASRAATRKTFGTPPRRGSVHRLAAAVARRARFRRPTNFRPDDRTGPDGPISGRRAPPVDQPDGSPDQGSCTPAARRRQRLPVRHVCTAIPVTSKCPYGVRARTTRSAASMLSPANLALKTKSSPERRMPAPEFLITSTCRRRCLLWLPRDAIPASKPRSRSPRQRSKDSACSAS